MQENKTGQSRSKTLIEIKKPTKEAAEETKYSLVKTKTIIDLNAIGKDSQLSGHYLFETADNRRKRNAAVAASSGNNSKRLGDLRLAEMWPQSNMCKLSQKASPWVRAQQEKSMTNELNTFFRISRDRSTSPTNVYANQMNSSRLAGNYFGILPSFKYTT